MTALLACLPVPFWRIPITLKVLGCWYPVALFGQEKVGWHSKFRSMGYKVTALQSAWGNSPVFKGYRSQPCAPHSPKCPRENVPSKAVTWLQKQFLISPWDHVANVPNMHPEWWRLKGPPGHHHICFIFLCKASTHQYCLWISFRQ